MSESSPAPAEPIEKMSMLAMAEFAASEIVSRCVILDGDFAGKTLLILDRRQAAALDQIGKTLAILSQHDAIIKQAIKSASYRKKQ
jgi:hypothetical protein